MINGASIKAGLPGNHQGKATVVKIQQQGHSNNKEVLNSGLMRRVAEKEWQREGESGRES
jgi:adenylate kinase